MILFAYVCEVDVIRKQEVIEGRNQIRDLTASKEQQELIGGARGDRQSVKRKEMQQLSLACYACGEIAFARFQCFDFVRDLAVKEAGGVLALGKDGPRQGETHTCVSARELGEEPDLTRFAR